MSEPLDLTSGQQAYLDAFISRFAQRTQQSKAYKDKYRVPFADMRGMLVFNPLTKEISYPIVARDADQAYIWDLDGNEYLDLTMDFGANLLGHKPPFLLEALHAQIDAGMPIGPQSKLAGEVSVLVSELTGMPRIAFSNSGTEAVMTALRLARASTGRNKVAFFETSYHGHSDATLAIPGPDAIGVPAYPGVLDKTVEASYVLSYGDPEALDFIQANGRELAAVLVEPVQSRNSTLQPVDFLKELREITERHGIVLIFDEIMTGFRVHSGGVQAMFGVQADIVTYGKIIGGGLPIGLVTGRERFMDQIDGGYWQFGDDSMPGVEMTFYAGTFCKHPLALVAARAVLQHLRQQGPDLHLALNARVDRFAHKVNAYFEENDLLPRIQNFGSIFRFNLPRRRSRAFVKGFPLEMELLFFNLLERGYYRWEGGISFISTAHTDAHMDGYFAAIQESIEALQEAGFSFRDL